MKHQWCHRKLEAGVSLLPCGQNYVPASAARMRSSFMSKDALEIYASIACLACKELLGGRIRFHGKTGTIACSAFPKQILASDKSAYELRI